MLDVDVVVLFQILSHTCMALSGMALIARASFHLPKYELSPVSFPLAFVYRDNSLDRFDRDAGYVEDRFALQRET